MQKIKKIFVYAVYLCLTTLLLFIAFNIALVMVLPKKQPTYFEKNQKLRQQVYPQYSKEELNALLSETWTRPFDFEPFTQFRERPWQGKYVNVSENGYRLSADQGPWPIDKANFNIFVFGGSTVFGYGVADNETIPSQLQVALNKSAPKRPVKVYNFGRGYYYSTQERILFENFLLQQIRPDLVVFFDGLNDCSNLDNVPWFTGALKQFMANDLLHMKREAVVALETIKKIPLLRFLRERQQQQNKVMTHAETQALFQSMIDRYLRNRQMIQALGQAYGVPLLFVWQPVPMYKFDESLHPFIAWQRLDNTFTAVRYSYQMIDGLRQQQPLGNDFIWLADNQTAATQPLYVDDVHYSAQFSQQLAEQLAVQINKRRLLN